MKKVIIKYVGIDDWNRPVYKDVDSKTYYGSTDCLFPDKEIAPNNTVKEINDFFREHIHEIEYFGRSFGCEPNGGLPPNIELVIED